MKKKDIQELKTRTVLDLEKAAKECRERIRSLGFDLSAGKLQNVRTLKAAKKELARMLTFISVHKKNQ